MMRNTM